MDFFDLHCDTPYECYMRGLPFAGSGLAVSGDRGEVFGRWTQCFAVWISDDAPEPYRLYRSIIEDFKEKLSEKPINLTPCFTVEGGAVLEDCTERLDQLKNDGVRALTLTWNGKNRIASGAGAEGTLTDFGHRVIERMNVLNLACDLSHLNQRSFYDALELAEKPLATHSCCRFVHEHRRNLSDEQLRMLAGRGGVIGICLYPEFLGGDVFERFYRNIAHMLDMGLEDSIAVGTDFDGAVMDVRLDSISKIPLLAEYLLSRGVTEGLLRKIFFENAQSFFLRL